MTEKNKWGKLAAGGAIFIGLARVVQSFIPDQPLLAGSPGPRYLGAPSPVPLEDMGGIIDFKLSGPADFSGTERFAGTEDFAGTENFAGTQNFGDCGLGGGWGSQVLNTGSYNTY